VGLLRRLARLIFGDDIDRALRPLLAVTFAGSLAGSSTWSFMGIWAVKKLDAGAQGLSVAFLFGAVFFMLSSYAGGHLSDHFGRRPVMLVGWAGAGLYLLGFTVVDVSVPLGLAYLACYALIGGIGSSVGSALVADLVPPERHEQSYASVRIAANLGVTMGPPVGGALLLIGWNALFVGGATLSALSFLLAYRYLPRVGAYSPEGPPERGSLRVIVRDRPFVVFMGSAILAWIVYVSYEVLLPVSLVDSHGVDESVWGFLVIVNPLLVTLFQMRITRWASPIPAALKLSSGVLLMGLPFLLFSVSSALPLVIAIIVVFVVGEMLWVPTSQSVVAGLAPEDVRGAYMGAFSGAAAVGFALAPFLGFQMRAAYGDDGMWLLIATVAVAAAVLGAMACRFAFGRLRTAEAAAT
jgi:MFS family permease